jgi:hypothetical protein
VLRDEQVLPCTTTVRNIHGSEYALTVDAIKRHLRSPKIVRLAFNQWTSRNKLRIMLFIADSVDRNCTFGGVQLASQEGDQLFFSRVAKSLIMMCRGPSYWSNPSCTFECRAESCGAHRQPFALYYD